MAGGGRPVAAGIALVAALALGIAWLSWGGTGSGPRRSAEGAGQEPDAGWVASGDAAAAPQPRAAGGATAPAIEPTPSQEAALAAVPAAPGDAFDTPEWQSARVAFRPRELGRLGPYVQAGLDSARRDMEFCFRSARAAAERVPAPPAAADPPGEEEPPPPPRADPAVLLLYVEAREGALDVIGTRLEHRGTTSTELVECCREVLRGLEIKAFNTVPGRRYRLKFRVQ